MAINIVTAQDVFNLLDNGFSIDKGGLHFFKGNGTQTSHKQAVCLNLAGKGLTTEELFKEDLTLSTCERYLKLVAANAPKTKEESKNESKDTE